MSLVDPGLNGQRMHQAEDQSHSSTEVNLKEEDEESAKEINMINPELEQQPDWSEDIRPKVNLCKEELSECDDKDSNRDEIKSAGIHLVFQEDCGSSNGATWQQTISESEECQKDAGSADTQSQHSQKTEPSDKITQEKQAEDTEETSEPGSAGKNKTFHLDGLSRKC